MHDMMGIRVDFIKKFLHIILYEVTIYSYIIYCNNVQ